MASTYLYRGRAVATPQAFTTIDASALEPTSLLSTGTVALIGSAIGGRPVSDITDPADVAQFSNAAQARTVYAGGDLLEAIEMAFNPANDPLVPGGAARIVALKVGADTQSTLSLATNSGASNVIDLTSAGYGEEQNQINVVVGDGSTAGKAVTVNFLDETNAVDNLGDSGVLSIDFEPGASNSWGDCLVTVGADGSTTAHATRTASLYLATLATHNGGDTVRITAANAANNGDVLKVWGVDGSGNVITDSITVASASLPNIGTVAFTDVFGMELSAAADTGDITVQDASANTLATFAFATSDQYKGLAIGTGMYVEGYVQASEASGVSTRMIVVGTGTNGAETSELITFTGTADERLLTSTRFTNITRIIAGEVNAAVTVAANAGQTLPSTYSTIQRVHDYYEDRITGGVGFTASILTGSTASAPSIMDEVLDEDGYDNGTSPLVLRDVVEQTINWFNTSTDFASAELSSGIVRPVWNFTVAATASFSWDITIGGTLRTYILDGDAATATAARDALLADFNKQPELNRALVATASGTDGIVITGRGGLGSIAVATPSGLTAGTTVAVAGRKTPPDNITPAAFFTGGGTVDPTEADYTKAFTLLRQIQANSVVPLTGDSSIHAALKDHCVYMAGLGKDERDGIVGLVKLDANGDPDLDSAGLWQLATKSELKSQIVDINSRHIRAVGQNIERFSIDGTRAVFPPWYGAVLVAGMQAGAALSEPLTRKVVNVLGIQQDSSWNPKDDSDEMIQAGLWFMESVTGIGRRCVRNVTTHLSTDNIAFVEGSVNHVVNQISKELRATGEESVGRPGDPTAVQTARNRIAAKADVMVSVGTMVAWRSLSLELNLDVLKVNIEVAVASPINFVPISIFLVNDTITA